MSEYEYLENINMQQVFLQTSADVWIVFCKFHDRDCKDDWIKEETLYGFCLRFRTLDKVCFGQNQFLYIS